MTATAGRSQGCQLRVSKSSSAGQIPYLSSPSGKTQSTRMAVAMVSVLQLLALVGKAVSVLQVAVRALSVSVLQLLAVVGQAVSVLQVWSIQSIGQKHVYRFHRFS